MAALLLCCTFASAQRFSVGAGYSHSTVQEKLADVETDRIYHNGIFAEAGFDAPINRYVSVLSKVQAGRFLDKNGFYYAKLPVLAKAIAVSDMDFKLFVYLGPEFSYRFNCGDVRQIPWNVWLSGGVGLDIYNRFRINMGYEHDFVNEFNGDYASYLSSHSTDFSIGISFLF